MVRRSTIGLTALLVSLAAVPCMAQGTGNVHDEIELTRQEVRANRQDIIRRLLDLTEQQSQAFWPIYREYDLEMAKVGDERVAMIGEYAANYSKLTDAVAEKLAAKAIELESRRQAVKAKCYERLKTVMSPRTALRFLQVEHQLQLVIDLQIAASLPIVK